MTRIDQQISKLERSLQTEIATTGRTDYYKIGHIYFQLSQLYKLTGDSGKASSLLNEAYLSLTNPECVKGRRTDRLLNTISLCRANPALPPFVLPPRSWRYGGLVGMTAGFIVAFLLYFVGIIPYDLYLPVIFVVLILSTLVPAILSSGYTRRVQEQYGYNRSHYQDQFLHQSQSEQQTISHDHVSVIQAMYGTTQQSHTAQEQVSPQEKEPDDMVDDAKAEMSLASMYFSMKNMVEAEQHLRKARSILGNPITNNSAKKEETVVKLEKLESEFNQKKF